MTSHHETTGQSACSVCGANMAPDDERCASCGATQDKRHACPFCGVVAQPQSHPEMRLVCPACGAPRVPAPRGLQPSKSALAALRTTRSARSSRAAWRIAAGLAAAFGALAVLLLVGVALIASPSMVPLLAGGLVTATPLVFAAIAWMKGQQRHEQVLASLDQAWVETAKQLASEKGSVRSEELMEAFGIEEDQARSILARLGANHDVTTDITDDGELALSMRVPLRVALPEPPPTEEVEVPADQEQDESRKAVK